MSLLEQTATIPSSTPDPLDEDLGLLRRASTRLKGVFSKRQRGISDVLRGAAPLLKQFERYMGRKNQAYDTLTWQTVIIFMASNATTSIPVGKNRGVPLNITQIGEVLNDATFRNGVIQQLATERVQAGSFNSWFPTATTLASKKTQLVGGPSPTARGKRTEVIMNSFMEAVVSKMFDIVDAAAAPEPVAAPGGGAGGGPGPGGGPGGGPGPGPGPGGGPGSQPTPPQFSASDLAALRDLATKLRGTTP